jgi:hypothetical protein
MPPAQNVPVPKTGVGNHDVGHGVGKTISRRNSRQITPARGGQDVIKQEAQGEEPKLLFSVGGITSDLDLSTQHKIDFAGQRNQ